MWDHLQKICALNLNAVRVAGAWATQLQILINVLKRIIPVKLFIYLRENVWELELNLIISSVKESNSAAPTEMDMVYCWAPPLRPN